ncbi:MAG: MtrB/PioB family outer membrane beta-barrel protein, partial [Burkholderiaceae bacterium]|nr:MtrB/PioB family outer membrane beta-barrel protein [Burkholderiaceae bacterium]
DRVYALRDTKMSLYSLDGSYAASDAWSFNAYLSQGRQKLNQARPAGYVLAFDNKTTAFGLGVTGKPGEKLEVGGGLSFINDKNVYDQSLDPGASLNTALLLAATGGLPEIVFRRTELRLFGRYALSKASALRLDGIHQRTKFDDWSHGYNGVPFTYSDNTTLTLQPQQNVTFVGVTYIYSWR